MVFVTPINGSDYIVNCVCVCMFMVQLRNKFIQWNNYVLAFQLWMFSRDIHFPLTSLNRISVSFDFIHCSHLSWIVVNVFCAWICLVFPWIIREKKCVFFPSFMVFYFFFSKTNLFQLRLVTSFFQSDTNSSTVKQIFVCCAKMQMNMISLSFGQGDVKTETIR